MPTAPAFTSCCRSVAASTLLLAASAATWAADPTCDALRAASAKLATVPSHQVATYQRGATRLVAMEAVAIGGDKWTRGGASGPWEKEPAQWSKAQAELNGAECRYLHEDNADGEPVAVYEVRFLNGDRSDPRPTQFWISKASGLPARVVVGDTDSTVTTRFDYRNVTAPQR